jgi:hypothetical protein
MRRSWQDGSGLLKSATFSMKHSLDRMLRVRPQKRFGAKLLLEDMDMEPQWAKSRELDMEEDMMQVAS